MHAVWCHLHDDAAQSALQSVAHNWGRLPPHALQPFHQQGTPSLDVLLLLIPPPCIPAAWSKAIPSRASHISAVHTCRYPAPFRAFCRAVCSIAVHTCCMISCQFIVYHACDSSLYVMPLTQKQCPCSMIQFCVTSSVMSLTYQHAKPNAVFTEACCNARFEAHHPKQHQAGTFSMSSTTCTVH